MDETVAGGQRQDVAIQVGEGEHIMGIGAMPTAVHPHPIPKNRNRPLAPNLYLDGVMAAADVVFQNVGVLVVGGKQDDVFEAELLAGVGVEVGGAVAPAGVTAVATVVSPGHIRPIIADLDLAGRFAGCEWGLAEGHAVLELRRPVLAALIEDGAQVVGTGEQGVFKRFVGIFDAEEAAVPKVGRDDAVEKFAVAEHEPHRPGRARVGEGGVIHFGDFQVNDAPAADGTDGIGVFAVENGRKPGQSAFGVMFEDQVGVVQAGLGADDGWGVGDFDG